MSYKPGKKLLEEIEERITHYPEKRSASLMILHAVQEKDGYISQEAIEWIAAKLELKPINIYELVTFYPMFRQEPAGKYVIKVCRTLSCMLGGSGELYKNLCRKLKVDPKKHGLQTSKDGKFSIEFVECLASCGTAPVMMINEDFHEGVTKENAEKILAKCK
jgi:NADH-quinone oxidoreductase subunit E